MAELNLKAIVKELNIDVPILATKMVGGKLMLYLYGGEVVEYDPHPEVKIAASPKEPPKEPPKGPGTVPGTAPRTLAVKKPVSKRKPPSKSKN